METRLRNHLILEYKMPKYDADLRSPNFFVPLSDARARKKVNSLMRVLYHAAQ